MSKCARGCFATSASAQRKPVHCSGLSARKFSDKNADMDYHAIFLPQHQAGGDSKRENLCQQDSERANKTTPGTSSSGRPVAREDPSSEKKVHTHPNTDGETYMGKFDHPANKFEPHCEEEHDFLQSFKEHYMYKIRLKDPTNLQDFPLSVAMWSRFYERLLMGFIFGLQRTKNTSLTKSLQRQVQTLIERTDAYNMQPLQDWKTFRWSRNTLLSGPAAKLFRMKVRVFSDCTMCVGVSNPDPSNTWATDGIIRHHKHGDNHSF